MTDEPTTKATQVLPKDSRTKSAESPKVGNPSQSPAPGAIREAPDQNEEDGDERETVSEEPDPSRLSEGNVGESAQGLGPTQTSAPGSVAGSATTAGPVQGTSPAGSQKGVGSSV